MYPNTAMEVTLTKEFKTRLMALKNNGKRTQYMQAMALLGEMNLDEKPSKTFHPDSRMPNCRKFELPEGYRIVFQ